MDFELKRHFTNNPAKILRSCGYYPNYDPRTGKESFIRRLSGDRYPRFHIYILEETKGYLKINLHLDMKKASYKGAKAHSAEYDGPQVETEFLRIMEVFSKYIKVETLEKTEADKPKRKLWDLFS